MNQKKQMILKVQKTIQNADKLKVNEDGFTIILSAPKKVIVAGHSLKKIPIGWILQCPKNKYGRVTNLISDVGNVLGGTLFVEESYIPAGAETSLEVIVRNHGPYPTTIIPEQHIASIQILTKPPAIDVTVVETFEDKTEETNEETNE